MIQYSLLNISSFRIISGQVWFVFFPSSLKLQLHQLGNNSFFKESTWGPLSLVRGWSDHVSARCRSSDTWSLVDLFRDHVMYLLIWFFCLNNFEFSLCRPFSWFVYYEWWGNPINWFSTFEKFTLCKVRSLKGRGWICALNEHPSPNILQVFQVLKRRWFSMATTSGVFSFVRPATRSSSPPAPCWPGIVVGGWPLL